MLHPHDSGMKAALWMGLRGLVPLVVLGAAGVGLLVFVQPSGDGGAPAPRSSQVAAPLLLPVVPPPPQPVLVAMSALVWTRDLGPAQRRFLRAPGALRPQVLCSALAASGWAMSRWASSEIDPALRECIGEQVLGPGAGRARSSAFLILRGTEARGLREVRLRLNVLDPSAAGAASAAAAGVLGTVFGQLRWNLPPEVLDALAARREITVDLSGTRLRFWREGARYNLGLELPEAPPPADRFTARGAAAAAARTGPASGLADLFGAANSAN